MMYMERSKTTEQSYYFLYKLLLIAIIMVALFLLVVFILPERTAAAGDSGARSYYITSVRIEAGDTLWGLAKEYYSDEFSSITNYIEEIKRMNGLSSDKLYAGNYILIPQYSND